MKFKIITSISIVCVMAMFFGMLMISVDDGGKEAIEKKLEQAKTLPLEENKYQEVNQLMTNYMNAKREVDMVKLSNYVNDISKYSENLLQQMHKLVTSVSNIKCYTIDGYEKDSYVVYLYYECRVANVKSVLPALVRNYVCKNKETNKLCVYSGSTYKVVKKYADNTRSNPAVENLIGQVNQKIASLQQQDKSVKILYEAINAANKQGKGNNNYNDANTANDDSANTKASSDDSTKKEEVEKKAENNKKEDAKVKDDTKKDENKKGN